MGGATKYFLKKLLGHEIFWSMVSWATNFFFEKLVKPPRLPSYILNVRSLKSNDIICNPLGTFLCLIISTKCPVLLMVYSDSLKGDNTFDKCFASWYVAVFKFDTIGMIGS